MPKDLKNLGFTMGDLIRLAWLTQGLKKPTNSKEMHDYLRELFPMRPIAYDYVARIAKGMEKDQFLEMEQIEQKKYYRTTNVGLKLLANLEEMFKGKYQEVLNLLKRIEQHMKFGTIEKEVKPLSDEYRVFFSKIISVKDIVRYMIFSLGTTREEFHIAQVEGQLKAAFGWSPSNGYLYDIAREMESEETLKGYWKEPEKRTKRLIKVTDSGKVFYEQIKSDLFAQVEENQKLLRSILEFLQ